MKARVFVLSMALVVTGATVTNAAETLWRAANSDVPAEPVPDYKSQSTPFPIRELPPEPEPPRIDPEEVKRLTAEELARQEQSRRAAYLLERIRYIIQQDQIFVPDVTNVRIDGRLKGEKGAKVLLKNRWLSAGDKVYVPAVGAEQASGMLNELEAIDEELANVVAEDINERLATAKSMELDIVFIEKEQVRLKDSRGVSYTISITPPQW